MSSHFDYRCPLEGAHDHTACLAGFAGRLHAFFLGEHLTRRTVFRYTGSFMDLAPARTIYPGNTIVDFDGLRYIIPFGHLRLRMSGPTAGRLIQAEIGDRFASANLPMLHRRTAADDVQDEFRPGVEHRDDAAIDIADEFERQFFGDVMLFSVVAWLKHHELAQLDDGVQLKEVVLQVEADLLEMYAAKHQRGERAAGRTRRLARRCTARLARSPGPAAAGAVPAQHGGELRRRGTRLAADPVSRAPRAAQAADRRCADPLPRRTRGVGPAGYAVSASAACSTSCRRQSW